MNQGLAEAIKQLRLSGLGQSLSVRLSEAAGNRLSHEQFLELVLQDELAVRGSRQVQRRVRAAMLIIDDMGMKQLPGRAGECLLEIILRRHENRSTIITNVSSG